MACLRCLSYFTSCSSSSTFSSTSSPLRRCKEGLVLALDPLDPGTEWACGDCGVIKSGESIQKLNEYFHNAIV